MTPLNWLKASEEERAKLYHVAKAVMNITGLPPDEFYKQALNGRIVDPISTTGNFSRGKISRRNAAMIYSWIETNHLKIGLSVAPDLFTQRSGTGWLGLLQARAQYGALRLLRLSARGLVRPASEHPIEEQPVRLGEQFAFSLESNIDGTVFAFQKATGLWHLMPLSFNPDAYLLPCIKGHQKFPARPDGSALPLVETENDGLQSFVFIVVSSIGDMEAEVSACIGLALRPEQLSSLSDQLTSTEPTAIAIHRINIPFVR
jgi:hypothetical protein